MPERPRRPDLHERLRPDPVPEDVLRQLLVAEDEPPDNDDAPEGEDS